MRLLFIRFGEARRALGLKGALTTGPGWLLRPVYLALSRELKPPIAVDPARLPVRWSSATVADGAAVARLNPAVRPGEVERRLAEGQRGLLGWSDGRLIYYRWDTIGSGSLPFLRRRIQLDATDLLTVDAYTDPAFRGHGLHSEATWRVLAQAQRAGLRRSVTFVAWWNRPALRVALEKAGREPIGSVGYWALGPWRCYFATGRVLLRDSGLRVAVGG